MRNKRGKIGLMDQDYSHQFLAAKLGITTDMVLVVLNFPCDYHQLTQTKNKIHFALLNKASFIILPTQNNN